MIVIFEIESGQTNRSFRTRQVNAAAPWRSQPKEPMPSQRAKRQADNSGFITRQGTAHVNAWL